MHSRTSYLNRTGTLADHIQIIPHPWHMHPPQEAERVMDTFNSHLHLPVVLVDHSKAMLQRLSGVSDPEAKRKAIGAEFIEVFKTYANQLEKELGKKPKFLLQVGWRQWLCHTASLMHHT